MSEEVPYSRLDRWTHALAFAGAAVQETFADIEATAFGALWRGQPVTRPIFVTSLPRAGTTLLLELLARVDGVASHTYRDMPFPRAPVLWDRLSRRLRARCAPRERAHRDGVMVSPDSPEALEEVLWMARFPGHFGPDGIALWHEADPTFAVDYADHIRRVIVARHGHAREDACYLAKNNANIARLPLLRAAFRDARIIVPLRDPLEQAASMLRQHRLFLERHRRDPFARRYMHDLGHFEFGALHRPILFDGVRELAARCGPEGPEGIDYWLGYWTAAFRHLSRQGGIEFLDMEAFCMGGAAAVECLLHRLGLPATPDALDRAARQVRPMPRRERSGAIWATDAMKLYAELRGRSALAAAA